MSCGGIEARGPRGHKPWDSLGSLELPHLAMIDKPHSQGCGGGVQYLPALVHFALVLLRRYLFHREDNRGEDIGEVGYVLHMCA